MRILLKKRKYSLVWALLLACLVGTSQAMAKDRYEVFKDKVPAGARISVPDAVREGGIRRRARITSMCNLRRHLPVFPDCLFLSVKIPARGNTVILHLPGSNGAERKSVCNWA